MNKIKVQGGTVKNSQKSGLKGYLHQNKSQIINMRIKLSKK